MKGIYEKSMVSVTINGEVLKALFLTSGKGEEYCSHHFYSTWLWTFYQSKQGKKK
jgi:hypothetical protein